MYRVASICLV